MGLTINFKLQDYFGQGFCWRVSNGSGLDVWNTRWISFMQGFKPKPILDGIFLVNWVSELIQENPRRWDKDKLVECFDLKFVNKISMISLGQFSQEDKMVWSPSSNGFFSTKSAFWTDQRHHFDNSGPLSKPEWKSL